MDKEIPKAAEIDALAQLYVDAQAQADKAQDTANIFHGQLITMVQEFGSIAPKSEKTRQLQGETWIVKVTQSQSVQINAAEVSKLRKFLLGIGKTRFFGKLFVTEERYTLAADAQQRISTSTGLLSASSMAKLRALFTKAVEIKPLSPRLKVEPLKKDKE